MMKLRKSKDRGQVDIGWLQSQHTFSFADYHDPAQMGFRSLRVINEDRVAPGQGFDLHPHRDVEVITYVLDGSLEHKDSLGYGGVLRRDDVQAISAGTGLFHGEFNPSDKEAVHLLQIWILPGERGLPPKYAQATFPREKKLAGWVPIVNVQGSEGALPIRQDAAILATVLAPGASRAYSLRPGRHAWVQVARGGVELNGQPLEQGDGMAISDTPALEFKNRAGESELLLFDLP